MEVGSGPIAMGAAVPIKVLGMLELIDEGEVDYKIIALRLDDVDAHRIDDMASLEYAKPGIVNKVGVQVEKTGDCHRDLTQVAFEGI